MFYCFRNLDKSTNLSFLINSDFTLELLTIFDQNLQLLLFSHAHFDDSKDIISPNFLAIVEETPPKKFN